VGDHTEPAEPSAYSMTASEASSLYELRRIWGDRYVIGYTYGGPWRAARMGNALEAFTTDTPEELRCVIQADYTTWQAEARKHQS
jgi:hypothetical protein